MIRTSTDKVYFRCGRCGVRTTDLAIRDADRVIKDIQTGRKHLIFCRCPAEIDRNGGRT